MPNSLTCLQSCAPLSAQQVNALTKKSFCHVQARTELVSMVDVDLLPSKTLADYLRIPEK